jgi:LemA protein
MESEVTSMVSRIRIVLPVVALGLLLSACGYNTIPTLEEQAKARWADVQNQYQRRADLIPKTGVLGRLLAVTENYPDLKSNANFLALQSQLEGTENRIAVARRDYIDAVRAYNTALRTFPTVLWAKTAFSSNKPMAEFTANEGAQAPPQVKF